jgi:hypothetical protein
MDHDLKVGATAAFILMAMIIMGMGVAVNHYGLDIQISRMLVSVGAVIAIISTVLFYVDLLEAEND